MKSRWLGLGGLILSSFLLSQGLALAQQAVGIVTALKGKAQLTRAATQVALSFKDNLILRDVIDTQEKSLTRVLFGGKSTVTVRELSRLEVREELLPGGGTRSIHELSSGSILVNVALRLLRRGDEVQIRTPNAVAAVRGTTVFAQYNAALAQSVFAVLSKTGNAVVTVQGRPSVTLGSLASFNVTGSTATGIQTTEGTITQAEANEIVEGSEVGTGGRTEESAEGGVQEAAQLADAVVEVVGESVVETIGQDAPSTAIEEGDTPVVEATSDEPSPGTQAVSSAATSDITFSGTISLGSGETLRTFASDASLSGNPGILVSNATITQSGDVPLFKISGVTVTSQNAFVLLQNNTITGGGDLLQISSSLSSGGTLLELNNTTLSLTFALIDIFNSSTITNTAGPWIKITGGSVTADSLLDTDDSGNTFNLTVPLLDLKDTTVTFRVLEDDPTSTTDLDDFNLTVAADEPLFRVDNSTLKITGTTNGEELIFIDADDFSGGTFKGVGLIVTNSSTISNKGGGLVSIEGSLTTTSTNALVQITGSTVETFTDAMFEIIPPNSGSTSVTMTGPLLSASATSTLSSERNFFEIRDSSSLTSNTTSAFIEFNSSTVNVGATSADTHFFQFLSSSTATFKGPLLSATDTMLNVSKFFVEVVGGSQFTNTGTSAVFQLTNSPLAARSGAGNLDDFLFLGGSGSKINVAGTLLSATNSNLTLGGDIIDISSTSSSGSQLTTTSSDPLVLISGGTHSIGLDLFFVTGTCQ